MPPTPHLLTIPFSHYCEKARWALERAGVPFVEMKYVPVQHARPMRRAGGHTVPVLVTGEATLVDSQAIVLHAEEHAPPERKLYPADPGERREVEAIVTDVSARLGVAARLLAYDHGLARPSAMAGIARPGLTRGQAVALPVIFALIEPLIRRMYDICPESTARADDTVRRTFADLGARLGERRYLVGDAFTAADLSFAALAGPVLFPHGHPAMSAHLDDLPAEQRALALELRDTIAGRHVLRLYREERRS